jgi:hypothetical protein
MPVPGFASVWCGDPGTVDEGTVTAGGGVSSYKAFVVFDHVDWLLVSRVVLFA